jgi:hypothetical protein
MVRKVDTEAAGELITAGEIMLESPVEVDVNVLLLKVMFTAPEVTDSTGMRELFVSRHCMEI